MSAVRLSNADAAALLGAAASRPRSPRSSPGRRRKGPTPEGALLKQCMAWLAHHGVWHERRNAGVRHVEGRRIRLGPAGTPDLLVIHQGRPIFVELKSREGRLRPSQRAWAERAGRAGAAVLVVRSLDDFIRAMNGEGIE